MARSAPTAHPDPVQLAPPPPVTPIPPAPVATSRMRRGLRLLAVGLLAAGGAALVGVGGAWLLVADALRSSNAWDRLGAAIFVALFGGGVAVLLYVVAVALAVVRLQPAGARLVPLGALLVAPLLLVGLLRVLG